MCQSGHRFHYSRLRFSAALNYTLYKLCATRNPPPSLHLSPSPKQTTIHIRNEPNVKSLSSLDPKIRRNPRHDADKKKNAWRARESYIVHKMPRLKPPFSPSKRTAIHETSFPNGSSPALPHSIPTSHRGVLFKGPLKPLLVVPVPFTPPLPNPFVPPSCVPSLLPPSSSISTPPPPKLYTPLIPAPPRPSNPNLLPPSPWYLFSNSIYPSPLGLHKTALQFLPNPTCRKGRCRSLGKNLCELRYSLVVSPRASKKTWYANKLPGYGNARQAYRNNPKETRTPVPPCWRATGKLMW